MSREVVLINDKYLFMMNGHTVTGILSIANSRSTAGQLALIFSYPSVSMTAFRFPGTAMNAEHDP